VQSSSAGLFLSLHLTNYLLPATHIFVHSNFYGMLSGCV